jgi:large conductance mechanosensitive channel
MKEFKEFAIKGNVMDMAVGVVIGGAFGKIVSSLVSDIIMPPLGVLISGVDFSKLAFTIKNATETAPAIAINYGKFAQTMIDFTIIAAAIFMFIKAANALRRSKEEPSPPPPPAKPSREETLLAEIRDLLKERK